LRISRWPRINDTEANCWLPARVSGRYPRTGRKTIATIARFMIASIQSILLEEDRVQMWRKNPDNYSGAVTGTIFSIVKRDFAPLRNVCAQS